MWTKTRNSCVMMGRWMDDQGVFLYCLNFEYLMQFLLLEFQRGISQNIKIYIWPSKVRSQCLSRNTKNDVVFLRSSFPSIMFYSFIEILDVCVCVLKFLALSYIFSMYISTQFMLGKLRLYEIQLQSNKTMQNSLSHYCKKITLYSQIILKEFNYLLALRNLLQKLFKNELQSWFFQKILFICKKVSFIYFMEFNFFERSKNLIVSWIYYCLLARQKQF